MFIEIEIGLAKRFNLFFNGSRNLLSLPASVFVHFSDLQGCAESLFKISFKFRQVFQNTDQMKFFNMLNGLLNVGFTLSTAF